MNIIFYYPSSERGGVIKILYNLIKYYSKKKNLKLYLITNKKSTEFKKFKNLKIYKIKTHKPYFINSKVISSLIAIIKLKLLLGRLNKKDTRILSMQSSFFSVILAFFYKVKIIVRVSEDPCGATRYADNRIFAFIVFLTKLITYNFSYKIITNASKSKICVKKFILNKKKVGLLFNPSIKIISSFKNFKRKKYILNVGRFCKQKNQIFLIKTFYEFNKIDNTYKLILCGDGPDKKKLIRAVKILKLDNKVEFISWNKNLSKFYKNARLFILSSYYEGMPNALIEAINCETPSISTNCSGVKEILLNGKGGQIIKNFDPKCFSKIMIKTLKNYDSSISKTLKAKKNLHKFEIKLASEKYLRFMR